ncbi:MAG TPA: hypothetical protein VGO59_11280 [Verrucomicrobiae bacterium]|jgi:hypothetical protein
MSSLQKRHPENRPFLQKNEVACQKKCSFRNSFFNFPRFKNSQAVAVKPFPSHLSRPKKSCLKTHGRFSAFWRFWDNFSMNMQNGSESKCASTPRDGRAPQSPLIPPDAAAKSIYRVAPRSSRSQSRQNKAAQGSTSHLLKTTNIGKAERCRASPPKNFGSLAVSSNCSKLRWIAIYEVF